MKQFLIATAALSLIGGAALAQTPSSNNPTNNPISDSTAKPGVTEGGPVAAGNPATPADGSPAAPAPMPSTTATPAPDSTIASNTAKDAPPATYPVCTSKHEDRCVNRSQATRLASNSMSMHHMKSTSSSTTTTTDQPAATPGQ